MQQVRKSSILLRLRSDGEFSIWARFTHALNRPILLRITRSVWMGLKQKHLMYNEKT